MELINVNGLGHWSKLAKIMAYIFGLVITKLIIEVHQDKIKVQPHEYFT